MYQSDDQYLDNHVILMVFVVQCGIGSEDPFTFLDSNMDDVNDKQNDSRNPV